MTMWRLVLTDTLTFSRTAKGIEIYYYIKTSFWPSKTPVLNNDRDKPNSVWNILQYGKVDFSSLALKSRFDRSNQKCEKKTGLGKNQWNHTP